MSARAPAGSTGTQRRLQALVAIGWPQARLARRLGMSPYQLRCLLKGPIVPAAAAAAVAALYDEVWDRWPTGPAADRARGYARKRRWVVPLGWDDDPGYPHCIDNPQATPAPGCRRPDRDRPRAADLAADAAELTAQGYTRAQAAARLGVSHDGLNQAIARCKAQRARTSSSQEGPSTMPLDHEPASGYQQGAAFGSSLFLRLLDAGKDADYIEGRHREAMDAARNDAESGHAGHAEREFTRGYADVVADRLATLRAAQRAERNAARWERNAEHEREAG